MMTMEKKKKFDRYDKVNVGNLGKEHKKYQLKEWKIWRGKGSDQYFLKHNMLISLTRAQKKFNKCYY